MLLGAFDAALALPPLETDDVSRALVQFGAARAGDPDEVRALLEVLPPDPLSLKELLRLLELARLPAAGATDGGAAGDTAAGDAPAEGAAPDVARRRRRRRGRRRRRAARAGGGGGGGGASGGGRARPERRPATVPPRRPRRLRELLLHRPVTARRAAAGGPVDVQHVVQLQPNNTMADAERWASELESTIVTDATL